MQFVFCTTCHLNSLILLHCEVYNNNNCFGLRASSAVSPHYLWSDIQLLKGQLMIYRTFSPSLFDHPCLQVPPRLAGLYSTDLLTTVKGNVD